jgi:carbon monoxide dehydrogenase subunit G
MRRGIHAAHIPRHPDMEGGMSIRFEVSEVIPVAPERVLEALLDLEQAPLWMPGLVRIEPLSPGPLGVGSEWRETRKIFGKEATEQFEIVELEQPRRLGLLVDGSKGSSGRGEYLYSYRLEPVGDETVVRLSGEVRGMRGVMAWLGKLLVGPYKNACRKDLAALKRYLVDGEDRSRRTDGSARPA